MTTADDLLFICAPTGRDALLTREFLARAGIEARVCRDVAEVCAEAAGGAAGLLLAEEALTKRAMEQLTALLAAQEPWSDLPIILFTGRPALLPTRVAPGRLLSLLGNVTLLDRPVRPVSMVAAARATLRARRRQYEARATLEAEARGVRQRDQFLAMLGHELRNPLGAIEMASQLLERAGDNERWRQVIRRQSSLLTRLVNDLLDVARVTSGKIALERVALELGELAHRCVQAVEPRFQEQRVALELRPAGEPLPVIGDPVRLEQALSNLLENAIKYTPPGERVRLLLARAGDRAQLSVADTGVGIAPEMLPRVFDLFSQAEGSLDRSRGGLGIGLTLVRSLVELHGGEVEAASPGLGQGSVFTLRLPLAPARTAPDVAPAPAERGSACQEVLVIEDNPDSRAVLSELLEASGHRVTAVDDGAAGLREALRLRPAVLVVDIGLPGMDGYTVAREVRRALGDEVFLIAVTGYGQPGDRRRAAEAGFDAHFTKPVDAPALLDLLARDDLVPAGRSGR